MFLVDFLQHLKRYGRDRLPELQIKAHGSGARVDFVFANRDGDGADLINNGERLGSVTWLRGEVVYEPPIESSERLSFDGHLDRWVGQAWRKAEASHATEKDTQGKR